MNQILPRCLEYSNHPDMELVILEMELSGEYLFAV